MDLKKQSLLWTGVALIGLSLVLLGLSFFAEWAERTEPGIAFLSLAAAFIFFQATSPERWSWRGWLYIPTLVFSTFGLVFLLNVITGDWVAWAYAWLLPVAGLGLGVALAARTSYPNRLVYKIGILTAAGGVVFFAIFGAIAGGPFMRLFSLVMLGAVGVLIVLWTQKKVSWLNWETFWPEDQPASSSTLPGAIPRQALVEPLSKRELEVLGWIDQGLSNAEIAERMVVAQSTVKTHINNIYAKLGAESRTQALRRAKDLGLLSS